LLADTFYFSVLYTLESADISCHSRVGGNPEGCCNYTWIITFAGMTIKVSGSEVN